ncbi:MAG: DNA polymerase III subunit beta [Elusimicrobia bacterium]|nr:DNA polymerase III subunit beta [Elusimicrobiota bacterium]
MKIKLDKKDLIERLQIVQNMVSKRSALPILSNYLLETDRSARKLWITSTDLEVGIKSSLDAIVEEDGSITLPARKLGEILHELPSNGSSDVVLELKDNNRVQVLGAHSKFQIVGIPKDDYPVLPEFKKDQAIEFPSAVLLDMIRKTVFAASNEETRYVLNGVLFVLNQGKVSLVATDGRRLAAVYSEGVASDKNFQAIIPTKALLEVGRVAERSAGNPSASGPVLVEISENRAGFYIDGTTIFSRLIDGNFPGWEQVIPRKPGVKATVRVEPFLAVTKRASLCISDRVGTCRYKFFKNHCQVTSKTLGHYEFEEEIDSVSFDGEEGFEISFNPHHVMDYLKNITADKFEIQLTTSVNPALFATPENPRYSYVVMPTRSQ